MLVRYVDGKRDERTLHMGLRVGYAKLGRSMPLPPDRWGKVGGDNEPPMLLNRLARQRPEDEFILIGRNSGDDPQSVGLPDNVVNPWTEWRADISAASSAKTVFDTVMRLDEITMPTWLSLDAIIVWAGQHGTSNSPIPMVDNTSVTNPQLSFVNYGSYIVRGISAWRDPDPHARREIWLCPDPRNYLKARDLKWPPPPVIAQFNWSKFEKHYRYGDPTDPAFFGCTWDGADVWKAKHEYTYDCLEVVGVPTGRERFNDVWEGRGRFGSIVNETRVGIKRSRLEVMRDWIIPNSPDFVHGTWSDGSQRKLGRIIQPLPWHEVPTFLHRIKATLAAPAVGTGWATAKPWETFASGTVCFFHPQYDTQDNVLGRPGFEHLKQWLRVDSPAQLGRRLDVLQQDRDTWLWLVNEQRRLFDQAVEEQQCLNMIQQRLAA